MLVIAYTEDDAFNDLKNGREKGLSFFFEAYYTPLQLYAEKITGQQMVAQDIVTDAFMKVWNRREFIDAPRGLKYFLYRIVRNACIDARRSRRIYWMPEENIPETPEPALIERLVESETHRLLFSLLHLLPPRSRQIYQMFYFEDKSLRQIARELGISINTVKTQKQRALNILKQHQASLLCLLIACLLAQ